MKYLFSQATEELPVDKVQVILQVSRGDMPEASTIIMRSAIGTSGPFQPMRKACAGGGGADQALDPVRCLYAAARALRDAEITAMIGDSGTMRHAVRTRHQGNACLLTIHWHVHRSSRGGTEA